MKKLLVILILQSIFSCILVGARIYMTDSIIYFFLIWNLFLAWLPLVFALGLKETKNKAGMGIFFVLWLLFFPNAPYILTDMIHLKRFADVPIWFDVCMLFSFTINGLMLGNVSLKIVHDKMQRRFNAVISNSIVVFILFLSSFGIYIGRFWRWNSWDAFTRPLSLIADIVDNLTKYPENVNIFIYTSIFGVILTLLYYSFEYYEGARDKGQET